MLSASQTPGTHANSPVFPAVETGRTLAYRSLPQKARGPPDFSFLFTVMVKGSAVAPLPPSPPPKSISSCKRRSYLAGGGFSRLSRILPVTLPVLHREWIKPFPIYFPEHLKTQNLLAQSPGIFVEKGCIGRVGWRRGTK